MLDTESTGHIEGVNWEGIYIGNAWRPGYELQGADKIGKQVIGSENPQLTKYDQCDSWPLSPQAASILTPSQPWARLSFKDLLAPNAALLTQVLLEILEARWRSGP